MCTSHSVMEGLVGGLVISLICGWARTANRRRTTNAGRYFSKNNCILFLQIKQVINYKYIIDYEIAVTIIY